MREIKFRGKRLDNGEWVCGFYWRVQNDDCSYANHILIDTTRHIANVVQTLFDIDPATVGQYTGLKDKNGVEIYEGDVLETPYYTFGRECGKEKHTVLFNNGRFGIKRGPDFVGLNELRRPTKFEYISNHGEVATEWEHPFEVISNIHDNPELLKEDA